MDNYARYSYEQLQMQQPHLITYGIYKKGLEYFIFCENINIEPFNNPKSSIIEVFDREIRIMGCPVTLVTTLPEDTIKMEERTLDKVINMSGNPFTIVDFNKQLSLLLPRSFPVLWAEFNHSSQGWDVAAKRELTHSEKQVLQKKMLILSGYSEQITCHYDENVIEKFDHESQNLLDIIVSKHSTFNYSKVLMDLWEKDEQLWSDNKGDIFRQIDFSKHQEEKGSTCLINGQFGDAHNIRNYLTLFSNIQIVVPIESTYQTLLNSLDITEEELVKLVELKRVKLLFPQSINRYDKGLLEKVASVGQGNVILTRELAYKTILDLKYRNPLVFLPFETGEKQEALSSLLEIASKLRGINDLEYKWIEGLVVELSNTWSQMYELLSQRGAMGTFNVGLGPIISTIIKSYTGKDYFIEIMQASNSIEWAAANNAALCPVGPLATNEERLAFLYSGVRKDWNLELVTSPNIATEGILTIANYIPVIELAETFSGQEIDNFRRLITDITHNKTIDEIQGIVLEFNNAVKKYEKNRTRTETWDLKGIALDTVLELTNAAVPFSGFLSKQLGRVVEFLGDKHNGIREIIQQVESKVYKTSPNVILVSKMRDKVKDLL
ncbi:hypothetical protein P4V43_03715 [Brevibacillus fortis]|uniref:hypothetical protein n=1 Tax=Brevibacillus fortis TaxID=2126352 RepID=UPI002E204735|nr:hypothetical protein [Brevibacillus fortis]